MADIRPVEHTPGPWLLKHHGTLYAKGRCGHEQVISTNGHSCSGWSVSNNEQAAHARLVAAAPQLLEVLRQVRYFLRVADIVGDLPREVTSAIDAATQAAIDAATQEG